MRFFTSASSRSSSGVALAGVLAAATARENTARARIGLSWGRVAIWSQVVDRKFAGTLPATSRSRITLLMMVRSVTSLSATASAPSRPNNPGWLYGAAAHVMSGAVQALPLYTALVERL